MTLALVVVTAVLLTVGVMLVLGAIFWLARRPKPTKTDDSVQLERFFQTREQLLAAINTTKSELERLLHNSLQSTTNLRTEVEGYQKLSENHLRQFADLFTKGTKATGDLGETLAERLLSHAQTINRGGNEYLVIGRQELIPDTKLRPDLTIKAGDGRFPPIYLDVKFPKEVYQHYLADPVPAVRKKLIKSLKTDIESISEKYLRLATSTKSPFAIIFLPSDRLFRDCLELDGGFGQKQDSLQTTDTARYDRSFIDFCFDNQVVPTSPANLIGVLTTLERYCQLFKTINDQKDMVLKIQKWHSRYHDINHHLTLLRNHLDKVNQTLDKIDRKMSLAARDAERLATNSSKKL